MSHSNFPPCLDCKAPLTRAPLGPAYPEDAIWSSIYLCPFCRTHRYKSEAHAWSRVSAALEKWRNSERPTQLSSANPNN